MFEARKSQSNWASGFSLASVIYHATVRDVRKSHRNPLIGLLTNIFQTLLFVAFFYLMFSILGMKGAAIRGDFLLYIMSGVFLYLTHNKAMSAVLGSEGPTSAMMQHAPMNTVVAITSSALSSLYIQVLSVSVVLFVYHAAVTPIVIINPMGALGMLLLAWFSGCAVGIVLLAIKPWFPGFVGIVSNIYSRANMIASGKMFVANTLPSSMLALFDWNPLFHTIDQNRGFIFMNYNPHFSSVSYPLYLSIVLLMLGMMGEYFTRHRASLSWSAGR
ncbi:ABC transporter permease [Actibacterium lipolyticum]|uniref:ABC-2 type transporter n=1 Tax=Actibacterium lipolyticum TaxID=1524263 RepID=A0A238KVI6_9RHOB|nr:ABC transporter permease [Actibacterium lipolyticum]SMX46864.1 ABC-2 type transporter [Actibacterium lipolyticum]